MIVTIEKAEKIETPFDPKPGEIYSYGGNGGNIWIVVDKERAVDLGSNTPNYIRIQDLKRLQNHVNTKLPKGTLVTVVAQ